MKSDVSALLDDALDESAAAQTLAALSRDPELRRSWEMYCLVGDILRSNCSVRDGFCSRVMRELAAEPTVIAPAALRKRKPMRLALPLAASVAGAAVVTWLTLSVYRTQDEIKPVAVAPVPVVTAVSLKPEPLAAQPELPPTQIAQTETLSQGGRTTYLFMHQAQSPSRAMQGVAQYVRVVSEQGAGR